MKKFFNNTIVQLLIAVILGIVAGFYVEGTALSAIVSLKHVSGQVIFFLVPLIILGFIAPSIAHLRSNASKKSFLIALKLAQYAIIAAERGERPLLLLDDVCDKLDEQRVEQLIRAVKGEEFGQIIITDCNEQRLRSLLDRAECEYTIFNVKEGAVER